MKYIEAPGPNHNQKPEAEIMRLVEAHSYLIDVLIIEWKGQRPPAPVIWSEGFRKSKEASEMAELVSAANFALVSAARQFNPDRGFQFSTYASRAIRNALTWDGRTKTRDPLDAQHASLDCDTRDATSDKNRPLHEMTATEWGDELPTFTRPMWDAIEGALSPDQLAALEGRLFGRTQADLAAECECTPQNISLLEQRAARKAERAIEGLRYPSDCRRDAMDYAYQAFQARNPETKVAERPRKARVTDSIEVRTKLEFRFKNFWADQMPGSGPWERQQNRRFKDEWAEQNCNPESKIPKPHAARPIAAPWFVENTKATSRAVLRRAVLNKFGVDGGNPFDDAVTNTIAKGGGWLLVKRVRGGWVASRPTRTVQPATALLCEAAA